MPYIRIISSSTTVFFSNFFTKEVQDIFYIKRSKSLATYHT